MVNIVKHINQGTNLSYDSSERQAMRAMMIAKSNTEVVDITKAVKTAYQSTLEWYTFDQLLDEYEYIGQNESRTTRSVSSYNEQNLVLRTLILDRYERIMSVNFTITDVQNDICLKIKEDTKNHQYNENENEIH